MEHSFFMIPFCRIPKTYVSQPIILISVLIFFMIQDHNSFSILTVFITKTTVKLYLPLPEKVIIMKLIIISVNRVCFLLCTQRGYATSFYRPQNFRALCLIWIANLPYDGKYCSQKGTNFCMLKLLFLAGTTNNPPRTNQCYSFMISEVNKP